MLNLLFVVETHLKQKQPVNPVLKARENRAEARDFQSHNQVIALVYRYAYLAFDALVVLFVHSRKVDFNGCAIVKLHVALRTSER